MIQADERAFSALTAKITRETGFRCASYKDRCLRRRIAVRMRSNALYTYPEYSSLLDADPKEYAKLLRALTINVTKFFRNWETYHTVALKVIPDMWASSADGISVWSAGCSSGEEPYSVGALFHQHAEELGEVDRLSRVEILGTDIDDDCLDTAKRALYGEIALSETPAALRERYFPLAGGLHSVIPEVRLITHFASSDVLHDPPPARNLDMIFCRNVIIYFERAAQDKLFAEFHECLKPGGVLVLGRVETLLGGVRDLFRPISSRERIFRKV